MIHPLDSVRAADSFPDKMKDTYNVPEYGQTISAHAYPLNRIFNGNISTVQ